MLNLNVVDRLVMKVYRNDDSWELDGYLQVFHLYFDTYRECFGEDHPNISAKNIRGLMDKMPYFDSESRGGAEVDLEPEDYAALINGYFGIDWKYCDYNINHFFSGQIRELRYYETL